MHPSGRRGSFLTRVKDAEVNCPDPAAPPAASKADHAKDDPDPDNDDDAKANEMMQKMLKQGQDFLDRQKQK